MKTIVIVGGGRHVGKTTLARALRDMLEDSVVVKMGTHSSREDKPEKFFPRGTPFADVADSVGDPAFLILESGTVLDDSDCVPTLVVFLPSEAGREDKPGSERRRSRADLVRGQRIERDRCEQLAGSLGVDESTFSAVLEAVGVPIA